MYILIVLFHFPQKGTKGREVLWDTSQCSHGEINLQMLFYHSIKIHTGVWKKPRSSEWLSWSKYVKCNQVWCFFPLKTVAPCVPENQSFIVTCHRNRNLSGGFLWACAHTSVSEELLPWEMWVTEPGPHQERRYALSFIVPASPRNSCELAPSHPGSSEKSLWFYKRSHVVGSRYLPCVTWGGTRAKRNNLPTSRAIRKWPGSFFCPTVLWETKSASSQVETVSF